MKKRTSVDFSKHELITNEWENGNIHYLKIPGTITNSIKFINVSGIMAVTGDFGNWIFCREFYPSAEGYVSDHYWIEKLEIASTQIPEEFDTDRTRKLIEANLSEPDLSEEHKDYYESLLEVVDSKWEFECRAYNDAPSDMDSESVPFCKKPKIWLQIIFDGFDEICRRLKEQNKRKAE